MTIRDASTRGTLVIAFLLFTLDVNAFRKPALAPLPDIDVRQKAAAEQSLDNRKASVTHIQALQPGIKVAFDPVVGSPRTVASSQSFLSDRNGSGRTISPEAAARFAGDRDQATKAFLDEHRGLFGHGAEVLTQAQLKRDYTSAHNGLRTTVWEQQVEGIKVFEGVLVSHTTKDGELVNISSRFLPKTTDAARAKQPAVSANEALTLAAQNIGETLAANQVTNTITARDAERHQRFRAPTLKGDAYAQLTWLPMDAKTLRLCWEVIFASKTRQGEMFLTLVDAQNGQVMLRRTLTRHLSPATYRVFTGESPTPMSPGFSSPNSAQPPQVSRDLITLSAFDTNASPSGWIDDGVNETRGNNVDAYLDRNADDQPDLPRPQGSPNRVFDFSLDLTNDPTLYGDASVVQLFYICNWYHDKLYELGFTEAAGNFQNNNFGRGGIAGDAVDAEAQDGYDVNNSDFAPTPDGLPPRLQMFIFTGPTPHRDGVLDTQIVLHEYTHGLSDRLVGGGVGLTADQSLAMSEGWSDFFALAMLTGSADNVDGCYPMAPYASYLLDGETENYYYGIRRYPYSTDMSKSPLTFKDIDPAQASPHYGVPMCPAFVFNRYDAIEPHNAGEVWCATLWEMRAGLIKKYGWQQGNQLALQLVTDGLRLSPPDPNFIEARDAIIQADHVDNNGANYRVLWTAFAKRGLGFQASSPSSMFTTGLVESFTDADDLAVTSGNETSTGPVGGPFTAMLHTWFINDTGANLVPWSAGTSSPWITLSQSAGTLLPGDPTLAVSAYLNASVQNLSAGIYTNTIRYTNLTSGSTQSRQFVLYVGQPDYFAESFDTTTNDLAWQSFLFTPDNSLSAYNVCRSAITAFPTDPTGGTPIKLKDDNFVPVVLSSGHKAVLYGSSYSLFFLGSNGYITFGSGDSTNTQSYDQFFVLPRISSFLDDLDPGTNGVVTMKELSDRVALTWVDVPEYGLFNTNDFQVEMFYDGRIRLSYLRMDALHGIVGLSRGQGIPSNFTPSDFSSYRSCDAPSAWLSVALPASVIEGAGLLAKQGSVKLSAPLASDLLVTLTSSDPGSIAVPASVAIPAGSTNVAFDLTVLDNALLDGPRAVIITPTAPEMAATPGVISVADNETPIMNVALPATIGAGATAQGQVSISPVPTYNVGVRLSLSGTGSTGAQLPTWIAVPAGQTSAVFTVQTAVAAYSGSLPLTVTAHVDQWTDATATMTVLYNQSTNLTLSLPSSVIAGNGTLTNYGWLALSNILAADLTVPLICANTNLIVPAAVTIPAGHKGAPFKLTVADHINGAQSARISEGLTGAFASIALLDDQTPLPPTTPMPVNGSTTNSCVTALSWRPGLGEGRELVVNGNFETADFTGWTVVANTNGGFVVDDGTVRPASGDALTAPYAGGASALGQRNGSGAFQMTQDIAIPADASVVALGWTDRLRNFAGIALSNQQFRVELRTTNDASLCTVFTSTNGGASDWTSRVFDISSFHGQTVRLCFVITAALAPLDVYLDNITLRAAKPPATVYDVYLGTNPSLTSAQLLGTTTNTTWPVMTLPVSIEYWQIVARRTGSMASPEWQFTTVPTVFLSNVQVTEGSAGTTTNASFAVSLSAPSVQTISLVYATSNGTATAGTDYVGATGTLVFKPGETNKTISVTISGDNTPEKDEMFWLNITSVTNAPLATNRAVCVILNDDPWPGMVDHFAWNQVPSPESVGEPFRVSVSAYDTFNNPVTNLSTLSLSGIALGAETPMLGNRTPTGSSSFGTYTWGLIFTPRTNITVTHARHYGGAKVSIWTDSQTLVAGIPVNSVPGQWIETPFPTPVLLNAGTTYRVGVYTAGQTYSWISDVWPKVFADGVIQAPCYSSDDSCPTNAANRFFLVDLRYAEGWPAQVPVSPTVASNVVGGTWNGIVTVGAVATNVELVVDDGAGHRSYSNPFDTAAVGPRVLSAGVSAGSLVLSWPAPVSTYVLESTDSLNPTNWIPVTVAPVQVGNLLWVTNPPTTGERYFRLRR